VKEDRCHSAILVRNATVDDADEIAQLFYDTVRHVNRRDYSREQIEAWAPSVRPASNWAERQATRKTYVAVIAEKIVGFAELKKSGQIDCFYCHKDHQRCGVGTALLGAVKAESKRLGHQKMFAEVSLTALPFFERQGFRVIREQEVAVRGVSLTNLLMERELDLNH
jgi:N-acetylglutamate synthase-like GNAT family acetyltransferase